MRPRSFPCSTAWALRCWRISSTIGSLIIRDSSEIFSVLVGAVNCRLQAFLLKRIKQIHTEFSKKEIHEAYSKTRVTRWRGRGGKGFRLGPRCQHQVLQGWLGPLLQPPPLRGTSTAASTPRLVTICGPSFRLASRSSPNRAFASCTCYVLLI